MANLRKLGRRTDHRTAMLRNLVQSLFENGKIETTVTRAKEVRREAEKMITLGKKGDLSSRREALKYIYKKDVVNTLFEEIAPVYADRQGGYTRILKLGPRRGDGSEMCILELVNTLKEQLTKNLKDVSEADIEKVIIAYEPIWAIGTGKTASAEDADDMCGFIRNFIKETYSEAASEKIRIQYGGSMKPSNVKELLAKENIDGGLIGGASLKASDFEQLVNFKK